MKIFTLTKGLLHLDDDETWSRSITVGWNVSPIEGFLQCLYTKQKKTCWFSDHTNVEILHARSGTLRRSKCVHSFRLSAGSVHLEQNLLSLWICRSRVSCAKIDVFQASSIESPDLAGDCDKIFMKDCKNKRPKVAQIDLWNPLTQDIVWFQKVFNFPNSLCKKKSWIHYGFQVLWFHYWHFLR